VSDEPEEDFFGKSNFCHGYSFLQLPIANCRLEEAGQAIMIADCRKKRGQAPFPTCKWSQPDFGLF
jgi:hypothetical protein